MIKKNVLSIALLSLVWCSSSYSMDYGNKCQLQTSDGKTVLCDLKLCKLSTTITHVIEDLEDSSTAIPLPKVTEKTWNILQPLLQKMIQGNVAGINDLLQPFDLGGLAEVLSAAEYLDIKTTDEKIILANLISEKIVRRLLTKDSLDKFINNETFLSDLGLSEILSKKVAEKVLNFSPNIKRRFLQRCPVQSKFLYKYGVISAAFNQTEDKIVSASEDKTIRIWDVKTGECELVINEHSPCVNSVIFNPTGNKIVPVFGVGFNPTGDKIVSVFGDGTVRIWDVKTGTCEKVLEGHTERVNSAAFNQAGDKIVSASDDRTVRIWDVKTGTCERILKGHTDRAWSAAFNATGDKIVSGSWDKTVRIWDVKTGKLERVLEGHTGEVYSAAFNQAGDKIVSASWDKTVRIWDVKTGTCEKVLEGHTKEVWSAEFNQTGERIVSASKDGTVRIWDVKTGKCKKVLERYGSLVHSAAFNKSGDKIILVDEPYDVIIRDLKSFLSCQDYLENGLTLDQALLLVCCGDRNLLHFFIQNSKINILQKHHLENIFDSIDSQEIKDILTSEHF